MQSLLSSVFISALFLTHTPLLAKVESSVILLFQKSKVLLGEELDMVKSDAERQKSLAKFHGNVERLLVKYRGKVNTAKETRFYLELAQLREISSIVSVNEFDKDKCENYRGKIIHGFDPLGGKKENLPPVAIWWLKTACKRVPLSS